VNNGDDKRPGWKNFISYNALGWRMAERFQQDGMIAGDSFDVAFTLEQNDHPEFGGIELTLRDFKRDVAGAKSASIP
jgi:single-stranded-DNA-specific exonuclease